jgi:pimeloyl-ACP methyl ester carboxylesterase
MAETHSCHSQERPLACSQAPPTFRDHVLETQRLVFEAAGVSFSGPHAAESRLVRLPDLCCTANMVVTPRPFADAPVLVVLHGFGAGLATFAFALPALAKQFSVYLIDLPGMGASDRCAFPSPRGAPTAEEPQASIDFFLTHFDATFAALMETDPHFRDSQQRILCAHSLGGYLGTLWMLRDVDAPKFQSLCLVSPVGLPEMPKEAARPASKSFGFRIMYALAVRAWENGYTPQRLLRILPRAIASSMSLKYAGRFRSALGGDDRATAALGQYLLAISRAPPSSELAMVTILQPGAWARRPILPLLPQLGDSKVWFLYGERDWMDPAPAKAACASMRGPTKVHIVDKAEHNIHLTNCAGFAAAVVAHAQIRA